MPDVTLITTTRDRPEAFALCAHWMSRQTFRGQVQWVVVDDGDQPVETSHLERAATWPGWTVKHLRREPSAAACTLQDNLIAAVRSVEGPKVLIVEDDDYYSPLYLEEMIWRLNSTDLVGEMHAKYYNVRDRRWESAENTYHACLCRTGFKANLLNQLEAAARKSKTEGDPYVDLRLWKVSQQAQPVTPTNENMWHNPAMPQPIARQPLVVSRTVGLPGAIAGKLFSRRGLSVGIKGMPGRGGLGNGHAAGALKNADPGWEKLIEWLGSDAHMYMDLAARLNWRAT